MIDLNITLLIQLINFLVTLVVLNWLLVRPVREIIRQRKAKMHHLETGVQDLLKRADNELLAYEEAMARAREDAAWLRLEARTRCAEEEGALLDAASREAQAGLKDARAALAVSADEARATLRASLPALVDQATAKVLG